MAYTALYNKYRPRSFEQVAGQQAIVRTLRNAINNGKIAHAYLFCGPRGTGKTSMARLFAKALNCEQGLGHQCNECENCRQLNENNHPDVIEIDAASNNGVEQVRDLIDQVRYSPIKGRMKVYIIDEVHMMSSGAFNALLKTLEEPPNHVVFILATTEPHKVLPTILSRCQRYDFGKIDYLDMKEKLVWILKQENVEFEDKALDEIIELADGGMRDSLSLLDQALAYGGNKLLEKDVLQVFGLASTREKIDLLRMITSGEVGEVLEKLGRFLDSGLDIKRLCSSLLDILKDELIYRRTGKVTYAKTLNIAEAEELSHFIDTDRANQMINILLKAQVDFKSVSNIRSLFELTLLQMTTLFGTDKKDVIVTPITPAEPRPQPTPTPVYQQPIYQKVEPAPTPVVPQAKPTETPAPAPTPAVEPAPAPTVEVKVKPEKVVINPTPAPVKPQPEKHGYDPFTDGEYKGETPPSFLFETEGLSGENQSISEENVSKPTENVEIPQKSEPEPVVQKEPEQPQPSMTQFEEEPKLPQPKVEPVPQVAPSPAPVPRPEPIIPPTPKPEAFFTPTPKPAPAPTPVQPKPAPNPAPELPKIDTSMIFNGTLASEGTPLPLSDDTIVDIMVLGTKFKERRKELFAKWGIFESMRYDPKVGEAALLLSKGRPFCLCGEALLITFDFPNYAERANLRENQRILRQLVGQVVGREVFIHALDRNDSTRCQNIYFSKLTVGALPQPQSVLLSLPK